eukprot:g4224.t1
MFNPDLEIQEKFLPSRNRSEDRLGLLQESNQKELLDKWNYREKDRERRFGKDFVSGRGQSGEASSELTSRFRSPHSAFRVTGLAYHAWEHKLLEKPLPIMPKLDTLRQLNASDPQLVNEFVMEVLTDIDTLSGAFLSMYSRHGSLEDAKKVLKSHGLSWLNHIASKLSNGSYVFPQLPQLEPKSMNVGKFDGSLSEVPSWWNKTVPEAMRLILEAVFEPMLLRSSHGYRPSKGCYTALKELKLIEDVLRASYVDLSSVSYKNIGVPQTTLLSPILCNIYLHKLDSWFEDLSRCMSIGGTTDATNQSVHGILENRMKWGSKRISEFRSWKSISLKNVQYIRYGSDILIGIKGLEIDMDQLEVDLVKVFKSQLSLDYKQFQYNRASASSPEKEYVVFLGVEIYVAPQISSPGLQPSSIEAGRLPNRPRLCVPARLLVKKLEESGFVNSETKQPRYCNRMVLWECHEIVKYYDIVTKLFCMYYVFADNYHCLMLLYDVMKQSCALTLARKLGLKRMWHVHKHFEQDLIIRDMEGVALASFERPILKRPLDPFVGRDINPFIRIERPSRPKFPPVTLGESYRDPKFPMSRLETGIQQAKVSSSS